MGDIILNKYPDLKLEELKVGMRVRTYQLEDIYEVYILMTDITNGIYDGMFRYTEGTIVFIGNEQNKEYNRLFNSIQSEGKSPCIVINIPTGFEDII